MKKNIIISVSILAFGWTAKTAWEWKSPDINWETKRNLHSCIHDNPYISSSIHSMRSDFKMAYVPNAVLEAVNPHFPIIHIEAEDKDIAWVHIIYTDAKDPRYQKFIDATAPPQAGYPFYTFGRDFYDAPIWEYTLFKKPLSFWKGHAYAVKIDENKRIIECMGGVEWGFKLSFWRLRPQCLEPRALTETDWEKDRQLL